MPAIEHGPALDLGLPAGHQVADRFVLLRTTCAASSDRPLTIAALRVSAGGIVDLGGPFRVHRHHLVRDAGDRPVAEPTRRAVVGDDPVAQLDSDTRRAEPSVGGGGVEVLAPQRGVGGLPATAVVEHLDQVGDQHVIVRARITRPGGGVAGDGVQQAARRGRRRRSSTAAAALTGQLLEVGQRAVALGVEDAMHVLGAPDHAELGDRLVRRHHDLQPGPLRRHQPLPGHRVTGTTGTEDVLVVLVGDVTRRDRGGRLRRHPTSAGSRRARRSRRAPRPGGRRCDRARSGGGTRPSPPPSSASTPRRSPDTPDPDAGRMGIVQIEGPGSSSRPSSRRPPGALTTRAARRRDGGVDRRYRTAADQGPGR